MNGIKNNKVLRSILIWLPSIVIAMIFIQNGIGKVFSTDPLDKVITHKSVIIGVGIVLLIATALFLYNKTLILGTVILSLYMTCIVLIHMYKGKPFETAVLIVMSTIFAAFLRKPGWFYTKMN